MPRWNYPGANRPAAPSNAGLWIDRGYGVCGRDGLHEVKARRALVDETAAVAPPAIYGQFYERWKRELSAAGADCRRATVRGRLALGLGNASVIEAGLTLHQTYGTPYLPGSALKGLAAHYAATSLGPAWAAGSRAFSILFGVGGAEGDGREERAEMGHVTFFDALYIPRSATEDRPLRADVVTVHHQSYYNKPGSVTAPADYDDPTPIPFLSVTGSYLLALKGPDAWVAAAVQILAHALVEVGAGAKTAAGYGRMELEGFAELWPRAARATNTGRENAGTEPTTPEWMRMRASRDRLATLKNAAVVRQQARGFYDQWVRLTDVALRRRMAAEIVAKVREVGLEAEYARTHAWYQQLVKAAAEEGAG